MKSPVKYKKRVRLLCLIGSVFVLIMWGISTGYHQRILEVKVELTQIEKETQLLYEDILYIQKYVGGRWSELENSVVFNKDPVQDGIRLIRQQIGLFDLEIKSSRSTPLLEMKINPILRSEQEEIVAALSPYSIKLMYNEKSISMLLYMIQKVESSNVSGIIGRLEISSSETPGLFSLVTTLNLPQFLHQSEVDSVQRFVSAEELPLLINFRTKE